MSILQPDTRLEFPHVLIIEASAGSGKTHTLTKRFVQFLLSERVPRNDLTNILAITFTNNAAREMKDRILSWLKKLALGVECEERAEMLELVDMNEAEIQERSAREVERIIDRYSDLQIRTIDSFMNRVLRSSALELGLPPEMEITMAHGELLDYTLDLMLKEVGEGRDNELTRRFEHFLYHLNRTEPSKFVWNPQSQIRRIFSNFLRLESERLGDIRFERADVSEVVDRLEKKFKTVDESGLEHSAYYDRWKYALETRNLGKTLEWTSCPVKGDPVFKDEWTDLLEELAIRHVISRYYPYGAVYGDFKRYLDLVKRRTGVLHISDINKKLSRYIEASVVPEIYYRLGDRLHHFLIDEFQDTSRVQWDNLKPLLAEALSTRGSLFCVGDLKQAIYMFRKADYRIMRRIVNQVLDRQTQEPWDALRALESAEVSTLGTNYRSGGEILGYVDRVFKGRLGERIGADSKVLVEDLTGLTDYEQEPMKGRERKGYVLSMVIEPSEDKEAPERDVLLRVLSDIGRRYPWRDIAVLTRDNKEVGPVVEWLTEAGIPVASFSSLDIRRRRVVMELVQLLTFLNSPVDDLAFAAFIGGDVFLEAAERADVSRDSVLGFLFDEAKRAKKEYLYVRFREDERFRGLWSKFFVDLYTRVGFYPVYDLLCLALRRFRVFEEFPEETGFLVQLLEVVNGLEARGMNALGTFLQAVRSDDEDRRFSIVLPEYVDAVRVMTFHKSKGLGFPVVINLIYDSRPPHGNSYYMRKRSDGSLALYHLTEKTSKKCARRAPDLTQVYEDSRTDDQIGRMNLLYVVNTRGKNELYNLIVKRSEKLSGWAGLFEPGEWGGKAKGERESRESREPLSVCVPDRPKTEETGEKPTEWTVRRLLETRRGEFVHEVLARIEFTGERLEEELSRAIESVQAGTREAYDLTEVHASLLRFLGLPEVRPWFLPMEGRDVEREVEYSTGTGALLRMDRVVIDPDRVAVIDFKTGEEEMDEYESQVRSYVDLLGKVHRDREVRGYLAYVDSMKVVEVR
jgi:ATP-dependent exoDNAse (exonuclease V) beta subunit